MLSLVFDGVKIWGGPHEITVVDSMGVIQRIIERSESEEEVEENEEDQRLARAIELSLTSPMPVTQPSQAKAARVVRFNLPLLDSPPRHVPVVPRLRSVRFRPPPAPITPKPRPPSPPSREQRLTATMRFYQESGQRPSSSTDLSAPPESWNYLPDSAYGPPEVTPEPEPEPVDDSDAESFIFDASSSSTR